MSQISEFEQRIEAALARIGTAIAQADVGGPPDEDALDEARARGAAEATEQAQDALDRFAAEISQLKEALEAEQTANAQLRERVQSLKAKKDRLAQQVVELEAATEAATAKQAADRMELDDLIAALEPLVKEKN